MKGCVAEQKVSDWQMNVWTLQTCGLHTTLSSTTDTFKLAGLTPVMSDRSLQAQHSTVTEYLVHIHTVATGL